MTNHMPDVIILDGDSEQRIYQNASEVEFDTVEGGRAVYSYGVIKLDSITIDELPTKTTYIRGEEFNPEGLLVSAVYDNGATKLVGNYTWSPRVFSGSDTKVTISFSDGGITKTEDIPITIINAHIYGVSWDGNSNPRMTRTDDSANFVDPVPYHAGSTSYGSPFDELMPWSGMKIVEDSHAGTLVSIPKFWYKITQRGNGFDLKISDTKLDGFYTSPAHIDRGDGHGERDIVYCSRYLCNVSNYKSISGEHRRSMSYMSTPNTRVDLAHRYIHNLGTSIWCFDYLMFMTLWILFSVEFASLNMRNGFGTGEPNGYWEDFTGYTSSMPYHTGTMGSGLDGEDGVMQYRHIEDFNGGGITLAVDGVRLTNSGDFYLFKNLSSWSYSSGGVKIGTHNMGYGHITKMKVSDVSGYEWAFYPSEASNLGETYDTYFCSVALIQKNQNYYMLNLTQAISTSDGYSWPGMVGVRSNSVNSMYSCRLIKLPN